MKNIFKNLFNQTAFKIVLIYDFQIYGTLLMFICCLTQSIHYGSPETFLLYRLNQN